MHEEKEKDSREKKSKKKKEKQKKKRVKNTAETKYKETVTINNIHETEEGIRMKDRNRREKLKVIMRSSENSAVSENLKLHLLCKCMSMHPQPFGVKIERSRLFKSLHGWLFKQICESAVNQWSQDWQSSTISLDLGDQSYYQTPEIEKIISDCIQRPEPGSAHLCSPRTKERDIGAPEYKGYLEELRPVIVTQIKSVTMPSPPQGIRNTSAFAGKDDFLNPTFINAHPHLGNRNYLSLDTAYVWKMMGTQKDIKADWVIARLKVLKEKWKESRDMKNQLADKRQDSRSTTNSINAEREVKEAVIKVQQEGTAMRRRIKAQHKNQVG